MTSVLLVCDNLWVLSLLAVIGRAFCVNMDDVLPGRLFFPFIRCPFLYFVINVKSTKKEGAGFNLYFLSKKWIVFLSGVFTNILFGCKPLPSSYLPGMSINPLELQYQIFSFVDAVFSVWSY